jgi:transcriptional regulator with XRE-family HTH domain
MGSLEQIRLTLGLSRRKMCQLMLIDPSTWTRWTQNEDKIPPHIFKALQWYLLSIEKYPSFHPLHKVSVEAKRPQESAELLNLTQQRQILEKRVEELEGLLQSRWAELSNSLADRSRVGLGWKMILLLNWLLLLWLLFRG